MGLGRCISLNKTFSLPLKSTTFINYGGHTFASGQRGHLAASGEMTCDPTSCTTVKSGK